MDYLTWLSNRAQVIVVDGSSPEVFRANDLRCDATITHIPPDSDLRYLQNGKVAGVLTAVRRASHEGMIIADDDVRYDQTALAYMSAALQTADVVRPQNYFDPAPWHACLDTARTLLNRVTGGDWPGTLGVRRSTFRAIGGYDGNVLFENLELVRSVQAAGGVEANPLDLYVRRLPPPTGHFWSQRVRQAYDELARPCRLTLWLGVLPIVSLLVATSRWGWLATASVGLIAVAETGRRRAAGSVVFPARASLLAPLWVGERALCAWLAVSARIFLGGILYRGHVIRRAATPLRQLRRRVPSQALLHESDGPRDDC